MKSKPSSLYERMRSLSEKHNNIEFSILSLAGLKLSKSLILDDRVKSRDLYDLMWLMKGGHLKIGDFFAVIDQHANNNDHEYYKAVLQGEIPLDKDDEGLEPVGVGMGMAEIYNYFSQVIDRYEQELARDFVIGGPSR